MDSLTPEERSKLMGKILGKNTKPELLVRSLLRRALLQAALAGISEPQE